MSIQYITIKILEADCGSHWLLLLPADVNIVVRVSDIGESAVGSVLRADAF